MSGTVVSMARSMLMGAISVAASAAAAEMSLLIGVRKDIWFIKDELETMHAFLLSIEATKNKSMLLQVWAKQVRDLAYGIEDCLDEFMVHVGSQSRSRRLLKLKDRHRIASQIRDLKARVEEVSNRNTRYNLISTDPSNSIDEVNSYMEDIRSHSANNINEAELVGFVKPKEDLIKMVDVNSTDGLQKVICVVGMGGLGKTTLARKAYESKEDIINKFSCCAWVTVSQTFSKIEMLKEMIRQLLGSDSLKNCLNELEGKFVKVEDLANYLRKNLEEKRYFIVLDDLWTIDAWNGIKHIAFPVSNNEGSRVMVTTRDVSLAKECTSESLIYYLKHLQTDDATNLLLRKSRKTQEDMENYKETKIVVDKIVKKCGGLPLAVLTIGGMLATKKVAEWDSIYKQIPSELEINPSLEALRRIVTLSYNHLPSHLKSCFLFLSIFPEDSEIKRRRLKQRWVAEGFVRGRAGVNIEDVAEDYFNELINRSMIQSSRVNIEGTVKSCRVHDIVRDVMVSISRHQSFMHVLEDNVTCVTEEPCRHVAYHGSKCQKIGMDWSHIRSLTIFGERPFEPSPSICTPDMRMLRSLDLENAQFQVTQKDIGNIGLLPHLKYVNFSDSRIFSYSYIYKIPRSIGKLQGLHTLDIRESHITELPAEISKLKSLHSLRCTRVTLTSVKQNAVMKCLARAFCLLMVSTFLVNPSHRAERAAMVHMTWSSCWSGSPGVRVPKGIGNLQELQILEVVDIKRTSGKTVEELGKLVQLRKLGVATKGATKEKCNVLCSAIEKLTSLRSLLVRGSLGNPMHEGVDWLPGPNEDGTLEWLHVVPPPMLRTLKLDGCLREIPGWFGNLLHLVKLYLKGSQLGGKGESMKILGALPKLRLLYLAWESFVLEKLVFRAETFLNLRELRIFRLDQVRELKFEAGTSLQLEKIHITSTWLKSGINGIEHLPRLKEISLGYGGGVARLVMLQREVDAHPNHPVLRFRDYWRQHDLGEVVQGSTTPVQAQEATEIVESSLHPDPAAAGEISSWQVVAPTRSDSQDSEDDFCSCNSDDDDDNA